jgi:hypothetical protein
MIKSKDLSKAIDNLVPVYGTLDDYEEAERPLPAIVMEWQESRRDANMELWIDTFDIVYFIDHPCYEAARNSLAVMVDEANGTILRAARVTPEYLNKPAYGAVVTAEFIDESGECEFQVLKCKKCRK